MLKQFFNDILKIQPSFRSFLGDMRTNEEYENIASAEYKKSWEDLIKKYKTALNKDNAKNTIQLDDMTIRWIIESEHELLKFPDEWMYMTSYGNPIFDFIVEDTYIYPLKMSRDITDLISRTRKRIPFIKDVMKEMKDGIRNDLTIPKMVCKKLIHQMEYFMNNHLYYIKIPKHLDSVEYTKVVDTEYVPVLYEFLEFLKVHVKSCRGSIGLCHVKNGKDMYRTIIKSSTTLDITPEEIYEYGKQEIKNLYKELNTFKKDLLISFSIKDSNISNRALFKNITSRQSEYFDKTSEIIKAFKQTQEKLRKTIIPKYFGYQVKKYGVFPIPKLVEGSSPGAYYQPPSMASKTVTKTERLGSIFVNTISFKRTPKYTVDVLSIHEGIPGHHYQYQYMKQHKLPLYRIYTGDNDAYTEGWALYCEGFIDTKDPKVLFGKWIYSMLRTVRLVIDTGIHYYGWSYKKALNYMKRHIPMENEEIIPELERYICDPGQAVSYKIGERFFLEEQKKYLDAKYGTIKDFHHEVLECGPIPLGVLKYKLHHRMACNNKN